MSDSAVEDLRLERDGLRLDARIFFVCTMVIMNVSVANDERAEGT